MPSRPSPNAQAVEFPGKMSDGNQVGGDRFCGLANHGGRSLAPKKEAVSGKASRDQQRREKQDRAVWHGGGGITRILHGVLGKLLGHVTYAVVIASWLFQWMVFCAY